MVQEHCRHFINQNMQLKIIIRKAFEYDKCITYVVKGSLYFNFKHVCALILYNSSFNIPPGCLTFVQ